MSHSISGSGINTGTPAWGPAESLPTRPYASTTSLISPTGNKSPFMDGKFFPSMSSSGLDVPSAGRGTSFGTPSPSMSMVGGVGRNVSLASLMPTWSISPNEKRKYNLIFNTNDKDKSGFLSAEDARRVLTKYDLDKDILRKIWLV